MSLAGLAGTVPAEPPSGDAYLQEVRDWRTQHEDYWKGWLTVAGFFWLEPGDNPFGAGESNTVVLPEGSAPARAGVFHVTEAGGGFEVTVRLEPGVEGTVDDQPFTARMLAPDDPGPADKLQLGRLTLWVLKRDGKPAIRLKDPESSLLEEFTGIQSWDPDPRYRVEGTFSRYDPPHQLLVPNQLGHTDTTLAYGEVRFSWDGSPFSLVPEFEVADDSSLFLVFADATTGDETYGGGRFLYADLQPDGSVVLDFNLAYNPPCSFNPFTTCPLPPESNKLPFPLRAGEKAYRGPSPH